MESCRCLRLDDATSCLGQAALLTRFFTKASYKVDNNTSNSHCWHTQGWLDSANGWWPDQTRKWTSSVVGGFYHWWSHGGSDSEPEGRSHLSGGYKLFCSYGGNMLLSMEIELVWLEPRGIFAFMKVMLKTLEKLRKQNSFATNY